MPNSPDLTALTDKIEVLLELDEDRLISRVEWGQISFEAGRLDFDRIFTIIRFLDDLPIEILPTATHKVILTELTNLAALLKRINAFSIESGNPAQERNTLLVQLKAQADTFYTQAAPWIPFLAYQKGDISKSIKKISGAISQANAELDNAKEYAQTKTNEVDQIVTAAREASAAAGAAVFTKKFETAGDDAKKGATPWLLAAGVLGLITIGIAIYLWFHPTAGLDSGQIWQKTTTKIVVLGLLISATFWCGKIYKALMHQSAINKHRALSIQTLQAFVAAAAEPTIKDAVVLEAARSVFGNTSTGYIDDNKSSDGDIKILEVAKNILPHTGNS